MAAPSKNFTIISDARVDADSPWDESVTTDLRDNDIHIEEWMGKNYVAAVDHDHDGTNSAKVTTVAAGAIGTTELAISAVTAPKIAANAVAQSELKTLIGDFDASVPATSSVLVALDKWGHIPYVGTSNGSTVSWGWEAGGGVTLVNAAAEVLQIKGWNSAGGAANGNIEWVEHSA